MKKVLLLPLIAALLFQISCNNLPEPVTIPNEVEISKGTKDSITYLNTAWDGEDCAEYKTDLLVIKNDFDFWGQNADKVGTMTVNSDDQYLYFLFELSPELAEQGCYINKATALAMAYESANPQMPYMYKRQLTSDPEDKPSSLLITMPREAKHPQYGFLDVSFYCGDILGLLGYVEVCCGEGTLGGGGSQALVYELNVTHTLYAGNNDTPVGTGNVSIVGDNLVITVNGINAMQNVQIYIVENCNYTARPTPGQAPYGSHKNQGTFSNDGKTYVLTLPISVLEDIADSEDLCEQSFCFVVHAEMGTETAYLGNIKPVSGGGGWFRVFNATIDCRPPFGEEPGCRDAYALGNSRICIVNGKFEPFKYWYWISIGFPYCCE